MDGWMIIALVVTIPMAIVTFWIMGALVVAFWQTIRSGWNVPYRGSTEMDEGDYHSGPEGYSPNTAYQDSYYGTQWDRDEGEHR